VKFNVTETTLPCALEQLANLYQALLALPTLEANPKDLVFLWSSPLVLKYKHVFLVRIFPGSPDVHGAIISVNDSMVNALLKEQDLLIERLLTEGNDPCP
jgi:hypothetical protein